MIGHSLDARIVIHANEEWADFLAPYAGELPFLFIVSQTEVVTGGEGKFTDQALPGVGVDVERAEGEKCERCWNYSTGLGADAAHPTACPRCAEHLG